LRTELVATCRRPSPDAGRREWRDRTVCWIPQWVYFQKSWSAPTSEGALPVSTRKLTSADFASTIATEGIVLVDFWAAWCGPCRMFAPVYEAASEAHPDLVFGKVDTEGEQSLAAAAQITSIPTLMAFRNGILVFSQPGALPAAALEQVITAVRGLDMDEVRRQVQQPQTDDVTA
jgi:thioredoxin 1